ncbi:MAG TPA: tripartite tricarboxylate transporter substrate binding protein [Quisquiliibacterium sp.]|nr:tripartite tricarboxylate transporter substrate binding protein [Quisquiliibacterium sp.]HQP67411.1 tripartite tricarboxylate transporter substrate binding protein [Quisquiliibacterium sp.]
MNRFLTRLLAACTLMLTAAGLGAQPYPSRPVRVVVPYPAGQGTDLVTRYVAEQLSRGMGQNFVVDNRPGAAGNIGTQAVARAPADGYTLLMGTNGTHAAAPFLFASPGFDPLADFEPVALIGILPLAIVTGPANPVDSVDKLIAAAKARPDAINVAFTTTTSRATLELFKQKAGAPLFGVAYKGSAQAISDLIGGQVEYMVDTIASLRTTVAAGKLKALAVTSATSGELMPGVRSVAEQGVRGYELTGWNVLYAPKGTPAEVVRVLAGEVSKVMALPETRQKLLQLGVEPQTATGAELARFVVAERDKWGGVIRAANIRVD